MSLRVAIIGCGLIGHKRLNLLPPGSVMVACDTQLDRCRDARRKSPGCIATDSPEKTVSSRYVDAV